MANLWRARIGSILSLLSLLMISKIFLLIRYSSLSLFHLPFILVQDIFFVLLYHLLFLLVYSKGKQKIFIWLFLFIDFIIIIFIIFNTVFYYYFRMPFDISFLALGSSFNNIYGSTGIDLIILFVLLLSLLFIIYYRFSDWVKKKITLKGLKIIILIMLFLLVFGLITPLLIKNQELLDQTKLNKNYILNLVSKDSLRDNFHTNLDFRGHQSDYFYGHKQELSLGANRLNIVIFYLESLPSKYVFDSKYQNITENIYSQFSDSLLFPNIYSVYPTSSKVLPSFLCSVYPALSSRKIFIQLVSKQELDPYCWPSILKDNGYKTAFFYPADLHIDNRISLFSSMDFDKIKFKKNYSEDLASFGYGIDERIVANDMLDYIDTVNDPFFIMFWNTNSHHPYYSPDKSIPQYGKDSKAKYLRSIKFIDNLFGFFIEELRKRQLLDSTLIVVLGDHGEAFFEHPDNYIHSIEIYDENVNIPLLFINKDLFNGTTDLRVGSIMDVGPTILSILNLQDPIPREGKSLMGEEETNRSVYFFTLYGNMKIGLRLGDHKYIMDYKEDKGNLYNMSDDPLEKHPLDAEELEENYKQKIEEFINVHESLYDDNLTFLDRNNLD